MMDEYLDQYFSCLSWSDVNTKERLSWDYCEPVRENQVLPNSLTVYEDHEKNSPAHVITANHTMDGLGAKDRPSFVLGGELEFDIVKNLLSEEARHEKDDQNCNGNLSSSGKMSGNLKLGNVDVQHDTAAPTVDQVNLSSPKQLPLVSDIMSSLPFIDLGHVGDNGSKLSEVERSLGDLQTLSPSRELWLPLSYGEVSSLSPVMGQQRAQGFCLQGVNKNNDIDTMGNGYVGMDKILQFDNFSASIVAKGKQELQNHPLSCFSAEPHTAMTTVGFPSLQQTASAAPTGGSNGTGKPRVRARRGKATDPHSIAERLRREKIAERMKNLQELIPNSNKTDKASMLDEIIDYVKFLQLQVKVLSMSRVGAAGAVLPLITDSQAEGSHGLSLSPQADQGVDTSLNPDQVAFEEEVVKLLESNVTMAMQYLQSKGLCLMPIALAAAISSNGKAFEEKNKVGFCNSSSSSSSNNSFPRDGVNQMPMNSNIIVGKPVRASLMGNVHNGAVKQEVRNT